MVVRRRHPTLPTILAAGPPLTTVGGHCHFLGGAVSDPRAAVRAHAERGVDVVKIMASGGALTPGTRSEVAQFSPAELRAAADEAHRLGLPVIAHAHGTQAIRNAIEAGVDGLEHVTFMTADDVDPAPGDVLRALAAKRITVGLTFGTVPGTTPLPEIGRRMPGLLANGRRRWNCGAPVALGTDAGIGPVKPHDVLPYAAAQLERLGATPADALRTVTSGAAAACGLGDRKGRIAPGYDADLLAVDGDPLTDPAALQRVRAVVVRGHLLPTAGGR
ncbi:amidohydrolase family protein [Cryptosporangium japonicum]|uniref:amidohydrolase family protein n=1 Tax=Cryptosporangium japonicum TaxID=80872 RepID=UPI0031E11725